MKKITEYVNKEEFEKLKEKHPKALYYESKRYRKIRLSEKKEIRCKKE